MPATFPPRHFGRYAVYHATLRPWLWFLTRTADCRIFQKQKVPDIIKQIFRTMASPISKTVSPALTGNGSTACNTETDFNFVSRLMEQEGMYYYFTHENGKHMLVLADDYSAHSPVTNYATIPYFPPDQHNRRERDHIYSWSIGQQVQPGKYYLNDFDFENRPRICVAC
ncbi:MAG: phage late control D family protein [Candidatus Competibacteraceae bacterium]